MARDPAEIQADIAVTRQVIEHQLDALGRAVERRWWAPYAVVTGGLAVGFLLSRMPLGRLVGMAAGTLQTGLALATALSAVDRFVADRRRLRSKQSEVTDRHCLQRVPGTDRRDGHAVAATWAAGGPA